MNAPEFPDKRQNLDQFIEKVEQLERKRRRHIGQISLVTLAILGGISTLFWQMNGSAKPKEPVAFRTYLASELNPENIRTLFQENRQKIIILYDDTEEVDTVASVREYLSIFHPYTSGPVVEGSIVSNDDAYEDEWEYEEEDKQSSSRQQNRRERKRNERKQSTSSVPEPMTPKSTDNIQRPEAEDDQSSFLASTEGTNPFGDSAPFNLDETEEEPIDDFSDQAFASANSDNSATGPSAEDELEGAVRARNIPPVNAQDNDPVTPKETPAKNSKPATSGTKSIDEPLEIADRMPSFPGGTLALQQFLDSRLAYPAEAREHEVEGKVYIRFIVNADGSLTNFKLLRGIGYGCDEEAMRVAQSLPKWIPGRQGLTRVPVKYTLPIRFELQ